MTPEQRFIIKIVFVLLAFIGTFFAGFGVRGYMANAEATEVELKRTQEMNATFAKYAKDLKAATDRNLALQNQINTLTANHTRSLNERLAENSALRSDLAVAKRMRLQGTNCPQPASGTNNPSPGGLGDGTPVELSEETRLLVWDLREDLVRDLSKLEYLQAWAREVIATNPDVSSPP